MRLLIRTDCVRATGRNSHDSTVQLTTEAIPGFLAGYVMLVVVAIALGIVTAGCTKKTPPQPPPSNSNTPAELTLAAQSGDLVAAISSGDINYSLSGKGSSDVMVLRIRNNSRRSWSVEVEVGTKLEPAGGTAQSMVVTKGIHVTAHPHEEPEIELEVACLDISKPPPAETDRSWRVSNAPELARFITCVNGNIKEQRIDEDVRPRFLQGALWKARGASRDEWIHFFETYGGATPDEAREAADEIEPLLGSLLTGCR
jgi:hypothetical protein